MRVLASILFLLGGIVFGLLFVWVFLTKMASGVPLAYVFMILYAIGCVGCVMAFRATRRSEAV